jgi:hypothetical protein
MLHHHDNALQCGRATGAGTGIACCEDQHGKNQYQKGKTLLHICSFFETAKITKL